MSDLNHLDENVQRALARPHRIDMTTIGRRSGRPRRIELVFHNIDGMIVISGSPGRRDWYANVVANPAVTLARAATNTFAGIRPSDTPGFIVAQLAGATAATALFTWLYPAPPADATVGGTVAPSDFANQMES